MKKIIFVFGFVLFMTTSCHKMPMITPLMETNDSTLVDTVEVDSTLIDTISIY